MPEEFHRLLRLADDELAAGDWDRAAALLIDAADMLVAADYEVWGLTGLRAAHNVLKERLRHLLEVRG